MIYNNEDPETNQYNKPEYLSKVQQYLQLLAQMHAEKKCKGEFDSICELIKNIEMQLFQEMTEPKLKFSIFDSSHNSAARALRLSKQERIERQLDKVFRTDPDFIAPYLIKFTDKYVSHTLNPTQSLYVKSACLSDLETEYERELNALQCAFEELVDKEKCLSNYLSKYQNNFDDSEYDTLLKLGQDIESHKKVLQQRMDATSNEFHEKLEKLQSSMKTDERFYFGEKKGE